MSKKEYNTDQLHMDIIYADEHIAVINKPAGLLSVPGREPHLSDCVAARVRQLFPNSHGPITPHRLDMDTSGIMIVGLDPKAHRELSIQFQERTVEKHYVAICEGIVSQPEGEIELAFRVDVINRPYQMYDPVHGRMGVTHWKLLGHEQGNSRIDFKPLTGRTHQLRLHASHEKGLGHPIVGDVLYGNPKLADRLLLHAWSIEFVHPTSDERLLFTCEPEF